MTDKRELVAILGFDPDELNTPEMDLLRFGFCSDEQPNTNRKEVNQQPREVARIVEALTRGNEPRQKQTPATKKCGGSWAKNCP